MGTTRTAAARKELTLNSTLADVIHALFVEALSSAMAPLRAEIEALRDRFPPKMLTVNQAAETIGCHPNTIRRMIQAGQLRYKRVGKAGLRVDASSLQGSGEGSR